MSDTASQSSRTPTPLGPVIADPAPLGLAAFAMTTLVLSSFNAGFLNMSAGATVLPLALIYGGLVQLLAGMWEFRRGNTFGATAFSSFGAFWLSYYFLVKGTLPGLTGSTPANTGNAVGLFLLVWGVFTLYMTIAAIRVSKAVLAVFVALTVTFVVLAVSWFQASTDLTKAGGWLGLITGVFAWYASFAGVAASTFGRPVVPTGPAE